MDNFAPIMREDVVVLKENSVYRVSDLFYRRGFRWGKDRNTILNDSEFKETIMFDYLTEMRREEDYGTFRKIVNRHREKKQYRTADPNHLVVHMRLGDVMDVGSKKNRCMNRYNKFYDSINIKDLPINGVTIVTALHFGHDTTKYHCRRSNLRKRRFFYTPQAEKKSWKVIRGFEKQTHEAGLGLGVFSNENIDEDICFMASSMFFVEGETSLSAIIARCLHKDSKVCG